MVKKISQREARALRTKVYNLERLEQLRRNAWASEWPGGVHLSSRSVDDSLRASIRTARKLGHAVVCILDSDDAVMYYALRMKS